MAACQPSEERVGWECIAPANPGGGWDLTCRSVAGVLTELGIAPGAVRTVNLPGAGGGVAYAHAVGRRAGDGTLLLAASPATPLRLAEGQFGHLTEKDVRWVGAVAAEYGILAVAADAPWGDLAELMAAWRADPSAIVASGGSAVAGQDHMKLILLARQAGIDPRRIRYVPFDGGGEAMTALLGGFVDVFAGEASEVEGQIAAGNLRLLAVLAPERLPSPFGGVPTAREEGFDVVWVTWRGFYAPPGLPEERYARWAADLQRLGSSPEWEETRERYHFRPFLMVGPDFEAFVEAQVEDFRSLSRELGLIQ